MFPYRLVIFDLDGTLVDSVTDIAEALDLTLQQLGLAPVGEQVVRGWVGEGARALLTTALQAAGHAVPVDAVMTDFMRHYYACLLHRPRLYPGVQQTLAGLLQSHCQLAICTNKPARFVVPLLQHLGIDGYFSSILGGDSLSQRKPSAQPLLHLAAQFGYTPDRCLMVGDSATDAGAAHAAAMPLALVRYGYLRGLDADTAGALVVVDDLRELLVMT
jgi:phosphoglycolate phosphatase